MPAGHIYRKYYTAATAALERELTQAMILAVEPDVRTLKKKQS